MREILRQNVTLPPDGRLVVDVSMLPQGKQIVVVVYDCEEEAGEYQSLEKARRAVKGLFKDVSEIDTYLDELRGE